MTGRNARELNVSENGFFFDPQTGHTFSLNATGALVFRLARQGNGPGEIAALLAEEYDVTPEDAAKDAADFLMALKDFGLLR
ncbi:MAG: hypothetical protein A2X40_05535 [Elusimicrobia bacterium GWC2_65_9]|nr:MAG: hypothetical protein A2X37_02185 [Elusimicrobia bacterium GWA2_66_18]OGR71788.1 MAG: hypothetical protein A2X40_05535 [Elusimicrobia bacterium GWC2_65_9]